MSSLYSPLRYPGGKATLFPFVSNLIKSNGLQYRAYAEPYAGGCGLALSLLYEGIVGDIFINDLDPSIWAFWHSVLHENKDLQKLIMSTPITIDEWNKQKQILIENNLKEPLKLGFALFFLNRTNRSGIISGAGPIGGQNQQGNYKIDCRFNREELANRIDRVARYSSCIYLSNDDAIDFIQRAPELPTKTVFCIDPPYFNKGSSLYTSFYKKEDHEHVARVIKELKNPWIVTYDNCEQIQEIYSDCQTYSFNINYSLQAKRLGSELLVASPGLFVERNHDKFPMIKCA